MNHFPLCAPGSPILGMEPDVDPAALPASRVRELLNLRTRSGSLTVRRGMTRLADPPVPGAEIRGYWRGYFEGAMRTFAAFRVGGGTRIYPLNGSEYGDEITGPLTRLLTDGPVSMDSTRDRDPENAADLLLICNYHDAPLAYSTAGEQATMGPGIGENEELNPPVSGSCFSVPHPKAFAQNPTGPTSSDSARAAITVSSGTPYIELVSGQVPGGVTVEFAFAGHDLYGAAPFVSNSAIYVSYAQQDLSTDNAVDFFSRVSKIEVYGTSNASVGWYELPIVLGPVIAGEVSRLYSDRYVLLDCSARNFTDATKIRFTLSGMTAMSAIATVFVKVVAACGDIPGNALHSIGFARKEGRSESAAEPCKRSILAEQRIAMGDSYSPLTPWPAETGIGSAFTCGVKISTLFPLETRFVVLYRSEPLSDGATTTFGPYYRVGWKPNDLLIDGTINIGDGADFPNPSDFVAPPAQHAGLPRTLDVQVESGRVFAPNGRYLWIGNRQYPLRFRQLPLVEGGAIDEDSALTLRLDAGAAVAVRGMAAETGANGLSPIVVLTSLGAHRLAGSDASDLARPARIGAHGCASPRAAFTEGNRVYWLGPNGRLNATDGASTVDLSTGTVKDLVAAMQTPDARLDAWDGYLRVSPRGTGYTVLLDTARRAYLADDLPGIAGSLDEGERWIGWSLDGSLWQLDDPLATGDGGDPVHVAVRFREIDAPGFAGGEFGRVGLRADAAGAGNWTVKARDPAFDDAWSETVRGDGEDWRGIWRWTTPQAIGGGSILVDVAGDMRPGMRLRSVVLELDRGETRADTNPGVEEEKR